LDKGLIIAMGSGGPYSIVLVIGLINITSRYFNEIIDEYIIPL
jgi:hypothetical protein